MINKKKMIIIGGAALVLIAAVSVTVSLIHNNSKRAEELELTGVGDELGIHYGGSFDEFADASEEDVESDASGENWEDDVLEESLESGNFEISESGKEALKKTLDERRKELGEADLTGQNGNARDKIELHNSADSLPEGTDIEKNEGTEELGNLMLETDGYAEHEVICDAESREEAESIASQISGLLLSWDYGVATIQIEDSVDELLDRLEQQGSNLVLYRNYNYIKK